MKIFNKIILVITAIALSTMIISCRANLGNFFDLF